MTTHMFDKLINYVGHYNREMLLDALYCELHNTGYEIDGNTEESDLEWFAQVIYTRATSHPNWRWEHESAEERERYHCMARTAVEQLPVLCERMSARLIRQSQLIKAVLESHTVVRRQKEKEARNRL